MKSLIKCLVASFLIIFLAVKCSQNKGNYPPGGIVKSDTSLCVVIYKNLLDSTVQFGEARRIVKDDITWIKKDSTTQTMQWYKDSTYLIILPTEIKDSSMVKKWGIPMLDSLGRRNKIPLFYIYDKKYVRNGWDRADSAIAQLQRIKL